MALSLIFDGDIELNDAVGDGDGFQFELLPSSRRGSPVPAEVTLSSFLRDGSIVEHDSDENREMTLQVRVRGGDSQALNLGEKRLNLATKKRTTLVWSSMDGIAPDTVFEVLTSNLIEPDWDDLAELRNQRTYGLRLVCLPHGHSVDKFTDDADTPAATGTVVNACETAAQWSSAATGGTDAPVLDAAIFAEGAGSMMCEAYGIASYYNSLGASYHEAWNRDTVSGVSIDTAGGGYLSTLIRMDWPIDVYEPRSEVNSIKQTVGGVTSEVEFTAVETLPNNWVRYSWPVEAGLTVTAIEYDVTQRKRRNPPTAPTPARPFIRYDAITLSTAATTDQQIVKVFDVPGSARGPGSLYISSPSDVIALGQVFAATARVQDIVPGFRPDGRRWATSGVASGTGAPIYGSYYGAASNPDFDVPVSMLSAGAYTIVALVKSTATPLEVSVTAQLRVGGVNTGPVSSAAYSRPNTATGAWQFAVVGTVYLPPLPMQNPASTALVRIEFNSIDLAEFYMVPAAADFSIVDCGSSTVSGSGSSSHLWIDSPDVEQPRGGWWRGPSADRASARSAWPDVKKLGDHVYDPGEMVAWVTTTNAQGPRATLTGFPWWFGNAGQ